MRWLIFFLAFPVCTAFSQGSDEIFAQANQLYGSKKYREAQTVYESLVQQGYASADLFYNLGNAYFKTQTLGRAIFYYEKALRLRPHDEDVLFNLEIARAYLKDKIIDPPDFFLFEFLKKILGLWSKETLGIICVGVWNGFLALWVLKLGMSNFKFWLGRLWAASAIVFMLLFAVLTFRNVSDSSKKEAVVLSVSVEAKSEPDRSGSTMFILHEGAKIEIRSEKDDWVEIKLADGKIGWLLREDVGVL